MSDGQGPKKDYRLLLLALLVGAALMFVLIGDESPNVTEMEAPKNSEGVVAGSDYVVEVSGKKIVVDESVWEIMPETDAGSATANFSRKEKREYEMFEQVITIFKVAMTERDEIGEEVTPGEYFEGFFLHEGGLTVHYRINKGSYWVMSRQTFLDEAFRGESPWLTYGYDEAIAKYLSGDLKAYLIGTRHTLSEEF